MKMTMDTQIWAFSLASVFVVSLVSLVGAFTFSVQAQKLQKIIFILVSFAVGGLLGGAIIHIIPHTFEEMEGSIAAPLLILAGILAFFIMEKLIRWRHCHILCSETHPHPVAIMNIIGDAIHNLVDGMFIAASYFISIPIGLTTTVAVVLHEIPQEIGDFAILVHAGLPIRKALLYNFISALAAFVGAIASLIIGSKVANFAIVLLPIAAGGFIYIAGSDLIPELQHDTKLSASITQLIGIIVGLAIMTITAFIE